MDTIRVSLDYTEFHSKPKGSEIAEISSRIPGSIKKLITKSDIHEFAYAVGCNGHTFCTATFTDGKRSKSNFEQQQFFALDFDNKDSKHTASFEDVKARAERYELPILFAYDTFSSTKHDKFRIVFLNDIPITNRRISEAMLLALGTIFPEADSTCYTDVSKLYFGGKELIRFDSQIPMINIESLFRNLTYFFHDKYKANHYKDKLAWFSKATGIALNKNGLLDVTLTDNPTEALGASQSDQNGKNSPRAFIYNIKANGEIFPNKFYRIKLIWDSECTSKSSVVPSVDKTDGTFKQHKNHNHYRKCTLDKLSSSCRLFREFENGSRDMSHDELFGLATNMIQVETGIKRFLSIQAANSGLYDAERQHNWSRHLSYIMQQGYKPQFCINFCPYSSECNHSANILSTARPDPGLMERLPGYHEEFYPIEEVQEDTYKAINRAFRAGDCRVYIIKSQTATGKSHSYLKLMIENQDARFFISVPLNLLKDEIYEKARKMGIKIMKTPSLEQIKREIPKKVWRHIQELYKRGKHYLVPNYIQKVLERKHIPCLEEYMKDREKIKNFDGSIITTHRYLLNMDKKRLKEYDSIIIDEDIIFKSYIPNQEEIAISELTELSEEVTDTRISQKIEKLLELAESETLIELDSFRFDNEDDEEDISIPFDLPSFCLAEKFYIRRASKEDKLDEDTVVFLKPATFFEDVKYIMVSATASEFICQKFFGENRVDFYECKKGKYKGTLNQYFRKSMSRRCIANNPGIIRRLMKRFNIPQDKVITFMKENIGMLHFGNAEGSNKLEGKDILVVGTPYHAEFLYKMTAFNLDLDFDEDEEQEMQLAQYNGYLFRFTTFKNNDLQAG